MSVRSCAQASPSSGTRSGPTEATDWNGYPIDVRVTNTIASATQRLTVAASAAAHGGEDRDLGAVGHGRRQAPAPPAALGAHEDVHVRTDLALLGQHAVSDARVERPQRVERLAERRRAARDVDVESAPPLGERPQGSGNEKGDPRHRCLRARSTTTARTQTTGGRPSTARRHEVPPSLDTKSFPLRVPK